MRAKVPHTSSEIAYIQKEILYNFTNKKIVGKFRHPTKQRTVAHWYSTLKDAILAISVQVGGIWASWEFKLNPRVLWGCYHLGLPVKTAYLGQQLHIDSCQNLECYSQNKRPGKWLILISILLHIFVSGSFFSWK